MKTKIHVNQHNIRHNASSEDKKPVFTTKRYTGNTKSHGITLYLGETKVGEFIYSPDKPLSCGAKVWFECDDSIVTLLHEEN